MSSLITVNDGTLDTTSPTLVLGYQANRESQNIIHDIIGGGIAVTLIRPRPRAGTLRLFYLTEEDAFESLGYHSRETTFSLSDTERPSYAMTYVLDGNLDIELDPEGRRRWVLSVDFQEVEL